VRDKDNPFVWVAMLPFFDANDDPVMAVFQFARQRFGLLLRHNPILSTPGALLGAPSSAIGDACILSQTIGLCVEVGMWWVTHVC